MAIRQAPVRKRNIITFEADQDVNSLIAKGITRRAAGQNGYKRGILKKICNEAMRLYLKDLAGKREAQR
jgi:hypothetical protein